jgi:hypothetical protein
MARPTKYNKKIVNQICSLIKKDSYTIAEICSLSGIHIDTFYSWQRNKPQFSEAIKKAREEYDQYIAVEAQKSLIKLLQGYDYDEKKTVYLKDKEGKPTIKEQTTTKKHVQPSVPAIIFTLTNKDPDNWKNRQNTELTGKDGKDLFAKLTDEELDKRITDLEKKLK